MLSASPASGSLPDDASLALGPTDHFLYTFLDEREKQGMQMDHRHRFFVHCVVAMLLSSGLVHSVRADEEAPGAGEGMLEADDAFFKALRGVLEAEGQEAALQRLLQLKMAYRSTTVQGQMKLARQVAYMRSHPEAAQQLGPRGPAALALLGELGVTPRAMTFVAIELLGSDNRRERSLAEKVLDEQESTGIRGEYNLSHYVDYLRKLDKKPPQAIWNRLFTRDAGKAFRLMLDREVAHDQQKRFRRAERAIDDVLYRRAWGISVSKKMEERASEALTELAETENWWARYYAVVVAHRLENLGGRQVIATLREDEHELVREATKKNVGEVREMGTDRTP